MLLAACGADLKTKVIVQGEFNPSLPCPSTLSRPRPSWEYVLRTSTTIIITITAAGVCAEYGVVVLVVNDDDGDMVRR